MSYAKKFDFWTDKLKNAYFSMSLKNSLISLTFKVCLQHRDPYGLQLISNLMTSHLLCHLLLNSNQVSFYIFYLYQEFQQIAETKIPSEPSCL